MPPSVVSTAAKTIPGLPEPYDATKRPLPGAWVALAMFASFAALAWLMARAELNIDPLAPASLGFALAFAAAGAVRYVVRMPGSPRERVARDLAEYYGLFTATALIGAVASYPLAAETHGYVDAGLQRSDALLHFHWLAWYRLVAAHRSLQLLGTVAYQSIFVSPALLLGYFAYHGDRTGAYRLLTAFWMAAVLALMLFRFLPAVGPLAYLVHGPLPYWPDSERYMADLIPALRQHTVHIVDLGAIRGLVSAPSFHAASAVLFIAAAWPQRALRRPLTALNGAMLLATPVEGTHYLTDLILGALVAGVALGATARLFAWRECAAQAGSTTISVSP